MSDAYENYLENWKSNHPNVVDPEFPGYRPDMTGAQPIYGHRVWDTRSKCFELADGRVLEIGVTTTGWMECYAVFQNRDAWNSYEYPLSFNQYWNG